MAIRTGREFLASLDDDRQVYVEGNRVSAVSSDARFRGAAQTLAELYDLQHDPAAGCEMTYTSPTSGEPVGMSFMQARSVDDLVQRRKMGKTWADATGGMFGRSPDYMNIMVTAFASGAEEFGHTNPHFAENVRAYYEHVRENDLTLTHTLINPQVDRSKPVEHQEKDLATKIVKETDAGIVVRGARMVATLAAFANELIVMPSKGISNSQDVAAYAFGFGIPIATPGLRLVCRPPLISQGSGSIMDYPLSYRLDETDCIVIFDDVLVPWERVFIHRDPATSYGIYDRTCALPHSLHQITAKNLAKSEFMMALGLSMAKSINIDQHLHVQGMLAELIQFTEFCRACLRASEADAVPGAGGIMTPASMPLWTVRMMFPKMFMRMCEIIQILGASGLVTVPSVAELSGPVGTDVEKYFQAANASAASRIRLFRLAFDAAMSSFSGRQQLYERYYTGDPVRLASTLYSIYDKQACTARLTEFMDKLERGAAVADERTVALHY